MESLQEAFHLVHFCFSPYVQPCCGLPRGRVYFLFMREAVILAMCLGVVVFLFLFGAYFQVWRVNQFAGATGLTFWKAFLVLG